MKVYRPLGLALMATGAACLVWRGRLPGPTRRRSAATRPAVPAAARRSPAAGITAARSALLRESADAVDRFKVHLLLHHPDQLAATRMLAEELLENPDDAGITTAEIVQQHRRLLCMGLCGEQPNSPFPTQTYAQSPEIGQEILELALLQEQQAAGTPLTAEEHRENLLRWAVVCDRMAQQAADSKEDPRLSATAVETAQDLQDHDLIHGLWVGPIGPHPRRGDSQDVARVYVRQEFRARSASIPPPP
jgi:hypothetical protein